MAQWMRGLANAVGGAGLSVYFDSPDGDTVEWRAAGWRGGKWITPGRGRVQVSDAAVIADQLEADGIDPAPLRDAVARCMRLRVENQVIAARAERAASELRKVGFRAMAADDLVFVHVDDAEQITRMLAEVDHAR